MTNLDKRGGILIRDPQFKNTFDIIRRKELTHTPMLLHWSRYGNFYSYSNFFGQSDLGGGGRGCYAIIPPSVFFLCVKKKSVREKIFWVFLSFFTHKKCFSRTNFIKISRTVRRFHGHFVKFFHAWAVFCFTG